MMTSWLKKLRMRFDGAVRRIRSLRFVDSYFEMQACDVVLCCADCDRTDILDGLAYSRFADGLAEELHKRGVVVQSFAFPYASLVGPTTWARAHSINRFFFVSTVIDRLRRLVGRKSLLDIKAQDFYARMLAKVGAKSLIGIGLPTAAIKAAKAANVRSVEILHGYGYCPIPWGWEDASPECLPDMVLAFDEVSAATFRQLREKGVTVCTVDNYWYRKFLDDKEFQRLPQVWREMPWLPKGRKIVLVSLSWGYDGDHGGYKFFEGVLKNGLFPAELAQAIGLTGDEYYWVFRLHPIQLTRGRYENYKLILDGLIREYGNCEWEMGTRTALPALLMHCHAHISMMSMTAYDASFMGVPSLMLCPTLRVGGANELMFRDLEGQGFLTRGDFDAQRIFEWLQSASKRSKAHPVKVDVGMPELCELFRQPR